LNTFGVGKFHFFSALKHGPPIYMGPPNLRADFFVFGGFWVFRASSADFRFF
jgi:hypothetical protein